MLPVSSFCSSFLEKSWKMNTDTIYSCPTLFVSCRKSGKINSYPTMQRSFFSVCIFSKSFTLTSLLFCIFLQQQEIFKSDTLWRFFFTKNFSFCYFWTNYVICNLLHHHLIFGSPPSGRVQWVRAFLPVRFS